jgi:alkylation response protein AidB-like acyl-CoA dehydrogenase
MHVFIVTPAGISREQAEALMKKKREGKYRAKERARAIVDAAVEAHEARCYLDDYEGGDRPERLLRVEACFESLAKLRALERGEDA